MGGGAIEPDRALYIHFGGSIESKRRWVITFPPKMPRLFSLNGEAAEWLSLFGDPDSHELAKMRRICIAGFRNKLANDVRLMKQEAISRLQQNTNDDTAQELAREKAWWSDRRAKVAGIAAPFLPSSSRSSKE